MTCNNHTNKVRDKLVELLVNSGCTADTDTFEELADYLLKNNGTVLPCKIGDEVWCIRSYNGNKAHPQKGQVVGMYYADDMRLVIHVKNIGRGFWGDRVFATEEEALENIMKEGGESA